MSEADSLPGPQLERERPSSYTCPGEFYSIPHSIHLARLAAFYSRCQNCEHRDDTGHAVTRFEEKLPSVPRPAIRSSLLTDENVRGVYLNEFDRNRARQWGEALAAVLWEQQPMLARREPEDRSQIVANDLSGSVPVTSRGPTVVVGFDERPSSPDIVTGAVLGLRRMGCSVIDLGQTAPPILTTSVRSLNAAAGLFVTGAGCDPSWTGFDLCGRGAFPVPYEVLLQIERDAAAGVGRQTRHNAGHHPQDGLAIYESSLAPRFHALRPFHIVCGSSTRLMPRILDGLFASLPCKLTHIPLPTRKRNLFDPCDNDLKRVAQSVIDGQHHIGLVIDEDGQHLAFVTDRGRLVTPREIARLLIEISIRENHSAKIVVATSLMNDATVWLSGRDASAIDGGESVGDAVRRLVDCNAALYLSSDGRVWFHRDEPACDALLVLASVLQALSLSDAPFSEVIARIKNE